MKLLHDLSGSVCLLLTMVIVQVICLWTFEIEKEIIEYILFMEISMLLCYIGIAWVKRRQRNTAYHQGIGRGILFTETILSEREKRTGTVFSIMDTSNKDTHFCYAYVE